MPRFDDPEFVKAAKRRGELQDTFLRTTCGRCRIAGCSPGEMVVEGGEAACRATSPCINAVCGSHLRMSWESFHALRNIDSIAWQDVLAEMAEFVRLSEEAAIMDARAKEEAEKALSRLPEAEEAVISPPTTLRLQDGSCVPWALAEQAYDNYVRLFGSGGPTVEDMQGIDAPALACLLAGHHPVKGHVACLAKLEARKEKP